MIKYALTLLFATLIGTASYAQKEKLELKLVKGQTYLQRMTSDVAIAQTMQGQQMNIKMNVNGQVSYKVLDKIDTIYTIVCKYESLAMKMDLPTGPMEFNSESTKEDDLLSKVMAGMKKNSFTLKMTTLGKVIDIKGIEKLFDGFSDIPGATSAQIAQMKSQLSQSFGEGAFKGNLESNFSIYPTKTVQVGDTWVIKGKLKSGMEGNVISTYTLKGLTSDNYLITSISTIATSGAETESAPGMKMKVNLNGDMKSDLTISRKTGWIVAGNIDSHLKGTSEILPNAQIPNGMSIPMDMSTTMKITDK